MVTDMAGRRLTSNQGIADYDWDNNTINFSPNGVITTANDRVGGNLELNPKISLDTMRFAKKIIPYDEIGGYSLDAIYYYFFPACLDELFKKRNIHSALSDCELTYQILLKLYDKQNGRI